MVFSKLGIVPDGGASWQLVQKLGYNKALQIALEGHNLDAANCLESGIANKVVPAADLEFETMRWASALAANSAVSQALTKQLMRAAGNGATNLHLVKMETEAQGTCAASDYCKQAYAAFLSK
jgi:2-(1,2-epoxy-1,2-dihydrophenyl)acetyl-CoA isomerase